MQHSAGRLSVGDVRLAAATRADDQSDGRCIPTLGILRAKAVKKLGENSFFTHFLDVIPIKLPHPCHRRTICSALHKFMKPPVYVSVFVSTCQILQSKSGAEFPLCLVCGPSCRTPAPCIQAPFSQCCVNTDKEVQCELIFHTGVQTNCLSLCQ